MIPTKGATKETPAIFIVRDGKRPAAVIVSAAAPASGAPPATSAPAPIPATAFPFILPDKPGPHESQALATNQTDGGTTYDVVYSIVTVKDGADVDEKNSAYALASCKACTTVAVSVQLVLVVGHSEKILPINVAEALNNNCPSCITTAIADQIVVSVKSAPSDDLMQRLTDELKQLDAIKQSGGSPADVAAKVADVQKQIEQDLQNSGLLYATPTPTPTHRDAHTDRDRDADGDTDRNANRNRDRDRDADRHGDRDAHALVLGGAGLDLVAQRGVAPAVSWISKKCARFSSSVITEWLRSVNSTWPSTSDPRAPHVAHSTALPLRTITSR